MKEIPGYNNFVKIQPIDIGLSSDKKYYIETDTGQKLLLRMADISEYKSKETIFNMIKRVADLNVPMPCPVDFGICNDGKSVYQLLTWLVDGYFGGEPPLDFWRLLAFYLSAGSLMLGLIQIRIFNMTCSCQVSHAILF